MTDVNLSIMIDDIIVNAGRREINPASVKKLAQSIDQIGLRHPITVKRKGDQYVLIAGRHRLEAFKKLDREHIPANIVTMTNDEARLWEIAENLHRAELTKLERDEQVAEWIRITEKLSSQVATKGLGHRPEGGVNAAARELGIDKDDAHRAVKVASLSEEAKEAARDHKLDNNRSALLAAARETEPEAQVARVEEIAASKVAAKQIAPRRPASPPAVVPTKDEVIPPATPTEIAGLVNDLCVALDAIDPIIDRIDGIGLEEFWEQIEPMSARVRFSNALKGTWRLEAIDAVYNKMTGRRGIFSNDGCDDGHQVPHERGA